MSRCLFCQGALEIVPGYAALERITSDSRLWPRGGALAVCAACGTVQKPRDEAYLKEIGRIYDSYQIYQLSSGLEQPVFQNGLGEPRSITLLKRAFQELKPPSQGRVLDIGCGNGGLLRSFAALAPGWTLAGTEMSDTHKKSIESIPGVEALYVGEIEDVPGQFDLITMMHSLEHFTDPVAFLKRVKARLVPNGRLLIQVPDFHQNPFDLLVADHVVHFSRAVLHRTLSAAGYAVEHLSNDWIAKEISLLAAPGEPSSGAFDDGSDRERMLEGVGLLTQMAREAVTLSESKPGAFGIFGTSNAGTWLAAQMQASGGSVDFFVDENQSRIGRQHLGRPILAPRDVASDAIVYVPLAPSVARAVVSRLGKHSFIVPAIFGGIPTRNK